MEKFFVPEVGNDNSKEGEGTIENRSNWRELKEQASEQAEVLLTESAPNFESMSSQEKIATIRALIDPLGDDNRNRFIAVELASRIHEIVNGQEELSQVRREVAA